MKKGFKFKKVLVILMSFILFASNIVSCGTNVEELSNSNFIYEVSEITVPEEVKIVGLGEASHGASELQILKGDVFKTLVKNNGCRVFAIEGDFGGAAIVDEYIHGGEGTAEEAVSEIGFMIYKTEEMAELVQWMREYNETAAEGEDIHFVGFDMQRFDNNKKLLFTYLSEVMPDVATEYEDKLKALTDDDMYDLEKEIFKAAEKDITDLITLIEEKIPDEEKDSEYKFALECAQSILDNTILQNESINYNSMRDEAMENKVEWICNEYDGLIFINGHNGHISKKSALGYVNMGEQLAERYKDKYFIIGTDVATCEFNGQSGDDYKVFTVNNENALTGQFEYLDKDMYYIDFSTVKEDNKWAEVINEPKNMLSLNVSFSSWQKFLKLMYTQSVTPGESYDAVIVLKNTTPTKFFD